MKSTVSLLVLCLGFYVANAHILGLPDLGLSDAANSLIDIKNELVKDLDTVLQFKKAPPRIPVPQQIKQDGYPAESHYVTTKDGYILNIHRIPHGRDRNQERKSTPVYIQHGLLSSSSDFVQLGPNRSLGYLLADQGYDVWLGNVRGNVYSRNHTTLSPDSSDFWQFSWNEIGLYDIPAIIDYILEETGESELYHIGHDQGTTTFYVMASEKPEYNRKIKAHISLAPMAFMKNMQSPLMKIIAYGNVPFGSVLSLIGKDEFMPADSFFVLLNAQLCGLGLGATYCKISIFAIAGFSPDQMLASDMTVAFSNYPAGASTKQLLHYGQEVVSGRFCKYDFGKSKNRQVYNGLEYPPDYPINKISTSVNLIYSSNDWLSSERDVDTLYKQLPNVKERYLIPIKTWNHMDYLLGKDAPKVVYEKVLSILDDYESDW